MHSDTRVSSIEINRVHFSDLWRCCCCCCFCFCLTCTGRANTLHPPPPNHHRTTTTTNHHFFTCVLSSCWDARLFVNAPRVNANRPTNLEKTNTKIAPSAPDLLHPPPPVCVLRRGYTTASPPLSSASQVATWYRVRLHYY